MKNISDEIANLRTQLVIAERRFSPQRCLRCGSTRLRSIKNLDGKILLHKCGGYLTKIQRKEKDEIRFMFKQSKIHLNSEGLRIDRSSYPFQRTIHEPCEYLLVDLVQEVINGDDDITTLIKTISENEEVDVDDAEVTFFSLSLMTYVILRFSNLQNRDDLLDQMTKQQIQDISHLYEDGSENLLLANYYDRYKEYFMEFQLIYDTTSVTFSSYMYLARRLFENVTGKSYKSHLKEILGISAFIGDHLVKKTNYVHKKINNIVY